MRASGLRAVAVATVLGLVVGVLRFAVALAAARAGAEVDVTGLELVRISIALTATTVGVLWIWGAIRAARGDEGLGGGMFALAATVAFAAVALDVLVTLGPLVDADVAVDAGADDKLGPAARLCWVSAQLALAVALARLAWNERRGVPMFGAAVVLVVSGPMLVFDPVAMALARADVSLAGAWWLGTVPALLVGTGIVMAAWGLPVPAASVWRVFGRSIELIRVGLASMVVLALASMVALATTDASVVWLRVALTGPLALLGLAVAFGALRTARRSIRWARWSFRGAALVILALIALEVLVGTLVPLGLDTLEPRDLALTEHIGVGLVVAALALLVLGCACVDAALRRPAIAAGVLLVLAAGALVAAIVLHDHPAVQELAPALLAGAIAVPIVLAAIMAVRLLGKGVRVAESRAFGERVRAAQRAAEEARQVHARWRAARAAR
jgi:hypothetical protein